MISKENHDSPFLLTKAILDLVPHFHLSLIRSHCNLAKGDSPLQLIENNFFSLQILVEEYKNIDFGGLIKRSNILTGERRR